MKSIINRKRYDTETARRLGSYANAGGWGDLGHFEESLYIKKSGEYFLHGEGGPQTKYAVSQGLNQWSGGEKIIPLDFDAARIWAEKHLPADAYERIFGEVSEDDTGTAALNLVISAAASDRLHKMASAAGTSMRAIVEQLIANAGTGGDTPAR